jgi:hypothetical protein
MVQSSRLLNAFFKFLRNVYFVELSDAFSSAASRNHSLGFLSE